MCPVILSLLPLCSALPRAAPAQVSVLEMDSHYLFRNTVEAKAVVVHLPGKEFVPRPHELASALKSQRPWDEL